MIPLDRRVTSFGTDPGNDVVLDGGDAQPHHAHILYEKGAYSAATTDSDASLVVNGKKKRSLKLSDGDLVEFGGHIARFVLYDQALDAAPSPSRSSGGAEHFQALHQFASSLMDTYEVPALLETLLDQLIDLTGAHKAFLLLIENDDAGLVGRVRVARNVDRATLEASDVTVSDSIVRRVLEEGRPLVLADALSHDDFKTSRSVVNLKLCSVMCVPLTARGSTLGLFYLGNDNAVNHFTDEMLDVVSVFASTAGQILANAIARDELKADVERLEGQVEEQRFGEIIGASDAMRDIFKKITRVASTDIPVLVEGETGTGKELVARALHQRSNRVKKPFITINCGAIPENLLESELFGH
ncbi:MAG: sigma 54-interacting transcriptional regulator, partial [Myxococcota bacterium]|nr:sigma 54-interacting transcriptional regulator [Myxococcota bacterium]